MSSILIVTVGTGSCPYRLHGIGSARVHHHVASPALVAFGSRAKSAGLLFSLAVILAPALLWTITALAGLALRLTRPGAD